MNFAVNVPINGTSLGQFSLSILREIKNLNLNPSIFPIGGVSDLSSSDLKEDPELSVWIEENIIRGNLDHDRRNSSIKIWHLNGAYESVSNRQLLFSFYELDSPTETELNVARNNVTIFSSNFTCDLFKKKGVDCNFVPLGFDHLNFRKVNRQYFEDDRIVFNLCGKFEKRKHHAKIINSWVRKYGNNKNYYLQCALYNHFMDEASNNKSIHEATEGKRYFNLQILRYMPKNSIYNDFLNSGDICIGMSGGEGWDLPCFHSVALGKHAVVMSEHAYKDWANAKNSVLVNSSGKIPAADGVFFGNDEYFNNGQIFDFNEDDFLEGCENAIKRVKNSRINKEGIKLQKKIPNETNHRKNTRTTVMPVYLFKHPETEETIELVQKMSDPHEYSDEDGIEWKRVWQTPNAMVDSDIDPFNQRQWDDKTKQGKGSVGDLWDRSKELSEKRKKVLGHDPIKDKYFRDYSKKRRGIRHPQDDGKKSS